MPDFRMNTVSAAVEMPVDKDSSADTGTHSDVNQMSAASSGAAIRFGQRCCIGIVLNSNWNSEFLLERGNQIAALPSGQGANLADNSACLIERTGTCNADSYKAAPSVDGNPMEHLLDSIHGVCEARLGSRRTFDAADDPAIFARGSDRNLGATNIYSADGFQLFRPSRIAVCSARRNARLLRLLHYLFLYGIEIVHLALPISRRGNYDLVIGRNPEIDCAPPQRHL
jgi:hypothetical protein